MKNERAPILLVVSKDVLIVVSSNWGRFSKVVNQHTELEHTPVATNLYQEAKKVGIPFIVGCSGGLPKVCILGLCCNFLGDSHSANG